MIETVSDCVGDGGELREVLEHMQRPPANVPFHEQHVQPQGSEPKPTQAAPT